MKTEFKGLTQSTIKLLNKEENVDVDFKREGIESEDIVAFANSKNGGVILIGVDEIKDEPGKVIKGKIVGTKVGDPEKLKIINKATDCLPPIQVKITYENIDDLPIIKVIIPSGPFRPYCTRRGVYKTRVNGRNAPLDPDQLFEIFFEREGKKFIERFQEATKGLMNELNKLVENFEVAEKKISDSLEGISSSADEAESNSMDTQSTVD
jgi:predicted HTH transcriptional regulator